MAIDFVCPYCGCRTKVADQFAGMTGNCRQCGQPVTIPGPAMAAQPFATPPSSRSATGVSKSFWLVLALSVVGLLVVVGGIVGVIFWRSGTSRSPVVNVPRIEYSEKALECSGHLHKLTLALAQYHGKYGSFPAPATLDDSGKLLLSWRVMVLPFLGDEAKALYEQFDLTQPWDAPKNKALLAKMPDVFRCPEQPPSEAGKTHFFAIVGEGCAWEKGKYLKRDDVQDPLEWTILIAESAKAVPWTKPEDLEYARLSNHVENTKDSIGSLHVDDGANVAFMNYRVRLIREPEDEGLVLKEAAKVNDGDPQMLQWARAVRERQRREWDALMEDEQREDGSVLDEEG